MLRTEHKRQRKTELGCDLNSANPLSRVSESDEPLFSPFPECFHLTWEMRSLNCPRSLHVLIQNTENEALAWALASE